MDIKLIVALCVIGVLFVAGCLFMRNTHPYAGSSDEPFESKQKRRRIGLTLISAAILVAGIVVLTLILMKSQVDAR